MDAKGNHKLVKSCIPEKDSPISFVMNTKEKCSEKIDHAMKDRTASILIQDDDFGGENACN